MLPVVDLRQACRIFVGRKRKKMDDDDDGALWSLVVVSRSTGSRSID